MIVTPATDILHLEITKNGIAEATPFPELILCCFMSAALSAALPDLISLL